MAEGGVVLPLYVMLTGRPAGSVVTETAAGEPLKFCVRFESVTPAVSRVCGTQPPSTNAGSPHCAASASVNWREMAGRPLTSTRLPLRSRLLYSHMRMLG